MPATQETDTEGSQVQDLPGLQNDFKASLSNLVRMCLKFSKIIKDWGSSLGAGFLPNMHEAPGFDPQCHKK